MKSSLALYLRFLYISELNGRLKQLSYIVLLPAYSPSLRLHTANMRKVSNSKIKKNGTRLKKYRNACLLSLSHIQPVYLLEMFFDLLFLYSQTILTPFAQPTFHSIRLFWTHNATFESSWCSFCSQIACYTFS